jgi:aminoglycoside phosphotransferase (APT) family kinase protein
VTAPSRLLAYLRAALDAPGVQFSEPPTPVTGGYDTRIFAFRLREAPPAFSGPLILRLLGPHHDPARVLREGATQNALAGLGYPAPRVFLAIADPTPLGGAGLVMERLPGRRLLEAGLFRISRVLVETQLRLHALDAEVLLRALDREGLATSAAGAPAISGDMVTLDGHLGQLRDRIVGGALHGLEPAMAWLVEHRPPSPGRRVICHGDFHPQNILVSGRRVTGVIDWPNVVVADAAYDVAATKTILSLTPVKLAAVPAALRWLVRVLRPVMVARYLAAYRRRRPIDPGVLAYYEALCCMRGLLRAAESRHRRAPALPNPLDVSSFAERLAARFSRITGVSPALPANEIGG